MADRLPYYPLTNAGVNNATQVNADLIALWDHVGATGIQGATGVTQFGGPQGETGLRGPMGATGIHGLQGVTGLSILGATGLQGPTGLKGDRNVDGGAANALYLPSQIINGGDAYGNI